MGLSVTSSPRDPPAKHFRCGVRLPLRCDNQILSIKLKWLVAETYNHTNPFRPKNGGGEGGFHNEKERGGRGGVEWTLLSRLRNYCLDPLSFLIFSCHPQAAKNRGQIHKAGCVDRSSEGPRTYEERVVCFGYSWGGCKTALFCSLYVFYLYIGLLSLRWWLGVEVGSSFFYGGVPTGSGYK